MSFTHPVTYPFPLFNFQTFPKRKMRTEKQKSQFQGRNLPKVLGKQDMAEAGGLSPGYFFMAIINNVLKNGHHLLALDVTVSNHHRPAQCPQGCHVGIVFVYVALQLGS